MRDAGKVVLKQHRGIGKRDTDRTVQFEPSFNTFVGDAAAGSVEQMGDA